MIEVERKCALTPEGVSTLQKYLQEMTPQGVTQQTDSYYDTPNWDLLHQAVFVRVRNAQTLQIKFDEEGSDKQHIACIERVFSLAGALPEDAHQLMQRFLPPWRSTSTFAEAVRVNALIELARIVKTRSTYTDGNMLVMLDHVEGLGDFVEVEIQCEEHEDTSEARARLEAFIAPLGAQPLTAGYTELWLRHHRPEAYQAGQYHL